MDRRQFQTIDCPYPCDSTCHNRIFEDDITDILQDYYSIDVNISSHKFQSVDD